jgi:ABC-type glycerol-3-phosphate transport system permease component
MRLGLLESNSSRKIIGKTLVFLILCLFSVFMIFPLVWMLSTALKPDYKIFIFPPEVIPKPIIWSNFKVIFDLYPIGHYTMNTLFITVMNIIGKLISCTLVGYGFAKFRAPGKNILFVVLLSTMMIPWAVTMVPLFILYKMIGWYNTYLPLWVPAFFGDAFFIFLLRQFIMSVPRELEEAAKMDGANVIKTLWHVIIPIIMPALSVVLIFTFFATWNDFLGPLLFLSDGDKATLQLAIQNLRGQYQVPWNYMMAISVLAVLPCLVVFFIGQRQIVEGIALTGVKS